MNEVRLNSRALGELHTGIGKSFGAEIASMGPYNKLAAGLDDNSPVMSQDLAL